MKKIISTLVFCLFVFSLAGCRNEGTVDYTPFENKKYIVIEVEGYENTIKMELYPNIAPITVERMLLLANSEFFDGLPFHRVVKNTIIQTGKGDNYGKPTYPNIKGEFTYNGVLNHLKHTRGIVSMARATDYDSASTQFFICQSDMPGYDKDYAAFGKVIGGMDVVDAICNAPLRGEEPSPKIVIRKAYQVES